MKINNTQKYGDKIGCKGKLVLIEKFNPIIISETEEIKDGDKFYDTFVNRIYTNGYEILHNKCYKAIGTIENISIETLQLIVEGKIKNGDEVVVECTTNLRCTEAGYECTNPFQRGCNKCTIESYTPKLNQSGHITLLNVKEETKYAIDEQGVFLGGEENWADILNNIPYDYDIIIPRALIEWFEDNFHPPKRK